MNHQEKWIEEHRLNRHPILQAIHDACQAVEACGASVALTHAVTKVGDLHKMAVALLNERDAGTPVSLIEQRDAAMNALRTVRDMAVQIIGESEQVLRGQSDETPLSELGYPTDAEIAALLAQEGGGK